LQAGGHRFDPGQLHQILIRCFRIAATSVTAIQKQAGRKSGGFQEPEGSAASTKEAAMMFDNEIDWVTHWKCLSLSAVRRAGGAQDSDDVNYKAEHKLG
jgi:hypothetical protein